MSSVERTLNNWSKTFANPPKLNQEQTIFTSLLGVLFLVMAVTQIIGYNDFKDSLNSIGISVSLETWAVLVIIAEVWAALGFFKVKLHGLIRFFSAMFAIFVVTFWLLLSLTAVTGEALGIINSGFFGKFMVQEPSWWTVVEASLLFFWTVYALKLFKKD